MTVTIFDYINNILFYKSEHRYQQHVDDINFENTFSTYMILRYLTMTKSATINAFISTRTSVLATLPQRAVYQFLFKTLPKQKFYRIQYIK